MNDRVTRLVIEFGGEDDSSIKSVLSAIKGQTRSFVSEIEASTKNIKLFGDAEKNIEAAAAAITKAKQAVDGFKASIAAAKAAGSPTADLEKGLKSAQTELKSATREFDKSAASLTKLENALTKAGVDTRNLAREQERLAESARQANAVLAEQASKALLGFKGLKDVQPQINQLNAAFQALRDGGKLTFGELSVAQARLQQQIRSLRAETGGLGQAFTDIRGRVIAFAAAFTAVGAGIFEAARNFRDFAQQVAALDSIAGTSKTNIDRLAAGVRELAKTMGVDAVDSTKALYEIIGSGIPQENALTVLEQSTKAAIAGLTDVKTAASVGVAILNGYGLQVTELAGIYDALFQTVRDGVVTFPELAKNIGTIVPAARAANVPLKEVLASFVVLTRQGIDAPEAATAINRAIIDLAAPAPDAAQKLADLGISFNGLIGTIEQFASRKLTLPQLSQLIPDVRAQRAIFSLIQNFQLLRDEIGEMNSAAGQMQAAYAKLANTPQQQVARFNSAIKDLSISIGEFVTGSGGLITSLTGIVDAFNSLAPSTKTTVLQFSALAVGGAALVVVVRQLAIPLNLLAGALAAVGTGGAAAATGITATTVAMRGLQLAAAAFLGFELGEELLEHSEAFRALGDLLGTVAGEYSNLAQFGVNVLAAALTGNLTQGIEAATAAFRRNREVLNTQWRDALTGTSERLRALDKEQQQLIATLGKTAAAAVNAAGSLDTSVSKIAANVAAQIAGVDQFITLLQARLTQLSANLTQNVSIVQTLGQAAIAAINANAAAQLASLDNLRNSELQLAAKTLAIQQKQAADRLAALKAEAAQSLKAFEAFAVARLDIAKRTEENLKKVEQDVALQRRQVLQSIVDANRQHVAELIQNLTAYQNKVREIELSRVAFNQAAEDQIRSIRSVNLDDYKKYRADVQEIDRLISEARKALANGDATIAEEYAKRAIAATSQIAKAVSVGGQEVVSASSAQATAIAKVTEAAKIGNQAFIDQGDAAKQGAAKTKSALESSIGELKSMETKLDEVSAKLATGIQLSITANTDAVEKTVAQLDARLAEQEHLLKIKADITLAQVEIQRLKTELDQGIPVNINARTEVIEAALNRIREAKPEIDLDVKKALDNIAAVRKAGADLSQIHVNIETNAVAVKKEIESLNGLNTESTHTIRIQRVEGNAAGGMVGESAQRFAGGGSVFLRPSWKKVPGSGDGDTVPARLQTGSFVVRKAASKYYGDAMMSQLARGYASGGPVFQQFFDDSRRRLGGNTAATDLFGDIRPGTTQSVRDIGEIGPPKLPSDPRALLRAILAYAAEVVVAARPESNIFGRTIDNLNATLRDYERRPDEGTLLRALQLARSIGLNIGVSSGNLRGFDIDGRRWHKEPLRNIDPFHALGFSPLAASYNFYNRGGDVDTVPAMLTPGEWVMNRQAVAKYGGGFMHALNNMQLPRADLANVLNFRPKRPPVARFADGGPVGSQTGSAMRSGPNSGGDKYEVHVHVTDLSNPDEFARRYIFPAIDRVRERGR